MIFLNPLVKLLNTTFLTVKRMWRVSKVCRRRFQQLYAKPLQREKNHLKTVIIANDEDLKKLQSLADDKQLSTNRKTGSFSIKKKLEDDLQQAKEEVKKADKLWNELSGGSVITKGNLCHPFSSDV